MTWKDIIAETARRSGQSRADTIKVLDALQDIGREKLLEGEEFRIPALGTLSSAWRKTRALRSIADMRKIVLDGRYVVRFRPAKPLKDEIAARTPQRWRDPRHQTAWRVAETLLGDLALYHASRMPTDLPADHDAARQALEASFGDAWIQARRTYEAKVDPAVRTACDHLVEAAIARWT
jgi:nucleoid DNA-binding protein